MSRAAAPRRILIVSLDNLGDLVFASSLTPPLHAGFPDASIHVWCKAYTADVARLIPHVDDVIAADPFWAVSPHLAPPSRLRFLRSIVQVRRAAFDVALLTGSPWRTAAAVAATGVPMRVGLARRRNRRFLTHTLPPEDHERGVVGELARLLGPLGLHPDAPHYALDPARVADVGARIGNAPPTPFVALHPFAATRDRCVPLDRWLDVAALLRARKLHVVWIGMPHEMAELRAASVPASDGFVDRVGNGTLAETAATLARAALFVGHDSGPMHVAASVGVPVVGLFAPGQPRRTFPQGWGAWRMVHRASPAEITTAMIVREIDDLVLSSSP